MFQDEAGRHEFHVYNTVYHNTTCTSFVVGDTGDSSIDSHIVRIDYYDVSGRGYKVSVTSPQTPGEYRRLEKSSTPEDDATEGNDDGEIVQLESTDSSISVGIG